MTPEMIVAFGGVLVALVTACGAIIVQLRNVQVLRKVETKQDVALEKQEIVVTKLEQVHQLTNSRLAAIEEQLKQTQAELKAERAAASKAETARATLAAETTRREHSGEGR